jgi:uncharacterized Zn-binding protein involved in type VI secretion
MPPAARITDFHACPMVTPGTPPIPHVGGPIIKGSFNVLTGKLPQARVGDMAVCVGPPDTIVKGSSGVFVNKMPAARIGDSTAHGGTIVAGLPTVIIGESKSISGGGAAVPKGALMLAYSDFVAQLKVLIDAQRTGAPFCEACFKAAQTEAMSQVTLASAASLPEQPLVHAKLENKSTQLGELSAWHETGGRGPGTVSPGDAAGGISYGLYQLSTTMGRPPEFLASEGKPWANQFKGLEPGTKDFSDVWRQVAAKDPEAFGAAQHAYIERTHYQAVTASVMQDIGLDIGGASNALQQAVWSTAVQHGPSNRVVHRALEKLSKTDPLLQKASDKDIINAIYDERSKTTPDGSLAYFSKSTPGEQASIKRRFIAERNDALKMLEPKN